MTLPAIFSLQQFSFEKVSNKTYSFFVDTGRNCRFLQGSKTEPADVKKIRDAVHSKSEVSACLLNYKKDGSTFINQVRGRDALTFCNS